MVDNLVQKYREVEDGESLDQYQRNPEERMLEADERDGRQPENRKLARGDEQVPGRRLPVQLTQSVARYDLAKLRLERDGAPAVKVCLHDCSFRPA